MRIVIALVLAAPATIVAAEPVFQRGVVAADHPLASAAGVTIMKQGGNVIDAAVATSFALSVTRPHACGIGGGGFMVIWLADRKKAFTLDYREVGPIAAKRDMFAKPGVSSHTGGLAVAVPGHVAGLWEAHRRFGKLPWKTVLQPAIRLAKAGFELRDHERRLLLLRLKRFEHGGIWSRGFDELKRGYFNNGTSPGKTFRFRSPQLAALELIAEKGPSSFYSGAVARAIVKATKDAGGVLTLEDLKRYRPKWRKPLTGNFDGKRMVTMPPPSSGGVAVLQILNSLAAYEREHEFRLKMPARIDGISAHVLIELMNHAFADRARYLGDPDFEKIPLKSLLGNRHAKRIAGRISLSKTGPLKKYGTHTLSDDAGTSHYCVMDAAGNAVACTETINTYYGSGVVVPGYGIVLNNEMDDFTARPGKPNAYGLIQSEANSVAAGKRPLSSMTPMIVLEDGKARFVVGGAGGPRIITGTLLVLLRMMRGNASPKEAVSTPRFHHQWTPDRVDLEPGLIETLQRPLSSRGHQINKRNSLSVVQAAARTKDGLQGGSDPRAKGTPAGW